MARHSYSALAIAILRVGCRSPRAPVPLSLPAYQAGASPAAPPAPQIAPASGAEYVAPGFPAGVWTAPLDDGCRIDMEVGPGQLRFVTHLKDEQRLTLEGTWAEADGGRVAGVMTRLHMEGPGLSIKTDLGKAFALWYAREGSDLVVTKFRGGGWDAAGENDFRRRYRRGPSQESSAGPRPAGGPDAPGADWKQPEPVVTGRPGDHFRVEARPRPNVTSTYEERPDGSSSFSLWFPIFGN